MRSVSVAMPSARRTETARAGSEMPAVLLICRVVRGRGAALRSLRRPLSLPENAHRRDVSDVREIGPADLPDRLHEAAANPAEHASGRSPCSDAVQPGSLDRLAIGRAYLARRIASAFASGKSADSRRSGQLSSCVFYGQLVWREDDATVVIAFFIGRYLGDSLPGLVTARPSYSCKTQRNQGKACFHLPCRRSV